MRRQPHYEPRSAVHKLYSFFSSTTTLCHRYDLYGRLFIVKDSLFHGSVTSPIDDLHKHQLTPAVMADQWIVSILLLSSLPPVFRFHLFPLLQSEECPCSRKIVFPRPRRIHPCVSDRPKVLVVDMPDQAFQECFRGQGQHLMFLFRLVFIFKGHLCSVITLDPRL